jgi:hypothetical protein
LEDKKEDEIDLLKQKQHKTTKSWTQQRFRRHCMEHDVAGLYISRPLYIRRWGKHLTLTLQSVCQ